MTGWCLGVCSHFAPLWWKLFPLDRAGRLARDVVGYPVDATNFVDNTISDACEVL